MTPEALAVWLPSLLLLLWLPGCFPLSGPSTVTGTEGQSLSVQCQYEEKYRTYNKYWCREYQFALPCSKIVETKGQEEVKKGRVSIRDHPANLTFTVTLEHLTLEDADTYSCGVNIPWNWNEGLDQLFKILVSVLPASTSNTPTSVTTTAKTKVPTALPTSLTAESSTQGSSNEKSHHDHRGLSLEVLLAVLAFLLLLLVGTSLLAWRMIQKRVKADKHPELSQSLRQATEMGEPEYVNLQLHTLSLREQPVLLETEYSNVTLPREDLHYTSVVFDSQEQTSKASTVPTQAPRGEEPEYSVIRKPRTGASHPHM